MWLVLDHLLLLHIPINININVFNIHILVLQLSTLDRVASASNLFLISVRDVNEMCILHVGLEVIHLQILLGHDPSFLTWLDLHIYLLGLIVRKRQAVLLRLLVIIGLILLILLLLYYHIIS